MAFDLDSNAITMSAQGPIGYFLAEPAREEKIKRPMNAFMVWASGRRRDVLSHIDETWDGQSQDFMCYVATRKLFGIAEISSKCPTMHNSDISRMLGREWKAMNDNQKRPFREEAKVLGAQHKEEHPDYKYCPKRKKLGQRRQRTPQVPLTARIPYTMSPQPGGLPSGSSPFIRFSQPVQSADKSDQLSERSDQSEDLDYSVRNKTNQKADRHNGLPVADTDQEMRSTANLVDIANGNRRMKSLTAGCTAIVGNPMEVFKSQQSLSSDSCSIYETGNKAVVVTFAKYNLTLRLEPEKLAASLLPIFYS